MNRDVLCEATPVSEAGLELVIANVLVARPAEPARAARADEGDGDSIANVPPGHEFAFGCNHARQFMSRHMWNANIGVVPHPTVPIASANAGRFDGDNHTVIGWCGIADVLHAQRFTKLLVDRGSHMDDVNAALAWLLPCTRRRPLKWSGACYARPWSCLRNSPGAKPVVRENRRLKDATS